LSPSPKAGQRRTTPSLGFEIPHHDINQRCPLESTGFPLPALRSVLGVSHALDGLLHHRPRGFVSPHSRVQGFPFRVFPSRRSRTGLLQPLPSCRSTPPPCSFLHQTTMPRLQGLAHRGNPLTNTGGLDLYSSRDPLGIFPLRVFTRHAVRTPSRPFRPWPCS